MTENAKFSLKRFFRFLNFPPNFPETPESCLVRSMVSHDPEKRPDAAEILKMDFMTSEHIKKESESASV